MNYVTLLRVGLAAIAFLLLIAFSFLSSQAEANEGENNLSFREFTQIGGLSRMKKDGDWGEDAALFYLSGIRDGSVSVLMGLGTNLKCDVEMTGGWLLALVEVDAALNPTKQASVWMFETIAKYCTSNTSSTPDTSDTQL